MLEDVLHPLPDDAIGHPGDVEGLVRRVDMDAGPNPFVLGTQGEGLDRLGQPSLTEVAGVQLGEHVAQLRHVLEEEPVGLAEQLTGRVRRGVEAGRDGRQGEPDPGEVLDDAVVQLRRDAVTLELGRREGVLHHQLALGQAAVHPPRQRQGEGEHRQREDQQGREDERDEFVQQGPLGFVDAHHRPVGLDHHGQSLRRRRGGVHLEELAFGDLQRVLGLVEVGDLGDLGGGSGRGEQPDDVSIEDEGATDQLLLVGPQHPTRLVPQLDVSDAAVLHPALKDGHQLAVRVDPCPGHPVREQGVTEMRANMPPRRAASRSADLEAMSRATQLLAAPTTIRRARLATAKEIIDRLTTAPEPLRRPR